MNSQSLSTTASTIVNQAISMSIIDRSDMPSLNSVMVDNKQHNLGIVKDFRKHPLLAKFLPEEPERVSFSWVRLLAGETLDVHSHPTASLILVCHGEGYCTGDITGTLSDGTAIMVPPHCLHGFVGAGEEGFWGLSIQLESKGLYEDISSPRVSFGNVDGKSNDLALLLEAHEFFMEDFKQNSFFSLLESQDIKSPQVLESFLDQIQYFSTRFQTLLKTRLDTAKSSLERDLAADHLEEEEGHDRLFAESRGNPVLTNIHETVIAVADWFEEQMRSAPEIEKLILMHFVLEGSGQLAHSAVVPAVASMPVQEHFALHEEEDEEHFLMGVDALKGMEELNMERLLTVLSTGWVKLNQMCASMAKGGLRSHAKENYLS